jgi:hypothetical protein
VPSDSGPFCNHKDLYATIDNIELGDAPWQSFTVRYNSLVADNAPSWKKRTYTVYCRNTLTAIRCILQNSNYDKHFDYHSYVEYVGHEKRKWSNLMSGTWAWKQAVSKICLTSFVNLTAYFF